MVRRMKKEAGGCFVAGGISDTPFRLSQLFPMAECVEPRRGGFGSGLAYLPAKHKRDETKDIGFEPLSVKRFRVNRFAGNGIIGSSLLGQVPLFDDIVGDSSVISWSAGITCFKGNGLFADIASGYGNILVNGAVLHGRFPTGTSPDGKRSHPFAMGKLGIMNGFAFAVNGDDVAGAPKIYKTKQLLATILHHDGRTDEQITNILKAFEKRLTGSDSEIISWLVYSMLASGIPFQEMSSMLMNHSKPYSLQGPFTGIGLVSLQNNGSSEDYLFGLSDGDRPLVCGERDGLRLMASEESQMPSGARIWRPVTGRFALATPYEWIERGVGTGYFFVSKNTETTIVGDREGFYSSTDVEADVAQDDGCASAGGDIVIKGNVGRRFANASESRKIIICGSVGTYGFMQLRNPEAAVVVGGGADNYLGWKASGGNIFVIRKGNEEIGHSIGSGIVGSVKIYVRGAIEPRKIGKEYDYENAHGLFGVLLRRNKIDSAEYNETERLDFNPWLTKVNPEATEIIDRIFPNVYPIKRELRQLDAKEKNMIASAAEGTGLEIIHEFSDDVYTVISVEASS